MSTPLARTPADARYLGRSTFAIIAAFVANAVFSLATDQLFHVLGVFPAWGQPMFDPGLNAFALSYRIVYGVVAGIIVARLAPRAPMRHAMILGLIGSAFATLGAVVSITQYDLGPDWYPIALAASAYPTIWLGARWSVAKAR
jgi:hypothetical protein